MSAVGKIHIKALLQHLQTLHTDGSVDSDDDTLAFSEMDINRFSDGATGTHDVESTVRCRYLQAIIQ